METKSPSQNKVRLIVVAIFLIGVVAGALSMNLYQRISSSGDLDRSHYSRPQDYVFDKLNRRLELTQDQQQKIRDILNDTFSQYNAISREADPKINAVRQQNRDRIRALLTKEQLPKYEAMVAESDKKREQKSEQNK